jgi:hypothetical protein
MASYWALSIKSDAPASVIEGPTPAPEGGNSEGSRECRAPQEPTDVGQRLVAMTLLSFLCSCFRGRCEPSRPGQTAPTTTSADLGQKEAMNEALSEEQLRHMEGGPKAKTAQQKGESRAMLRGTDQSPNEQLKPGDVAPTGTPGTGENTCPQCRGTGKLGGKPCPNCRGTGKVVQGIGGG